jgi:hypothetical protein
VIADLKRSLAGVGRRIVKLRREAMTLIAADAQLKERFKLLTAFLASRPSARCRSWANWSCWPRT